jgi:hypothetical protein
VKERPILFSGPMARALLDGTKTQTRRLVKPQPNEDGLSIDSEPIEYGRAWRGSDGSIRNCPYGVPGDRVWVRERMRVAAIEHEAGKAVRVQVVYEADGARSDWLPYPERLAPPVMRKCLAYGGYREASRIDLEITAVRVERLQAITVPDIEAEGFANELAMSVLWDEINGKRAPWASNPWLWVVSFRRVRP